VVLAFTCKDCDLACLAAFCGLSRRALRLPNGVKRNFFDGYVAPAGHPYPWRNAWAILFVAGSFLWFIFVYAAIRGGVRDRLAQLALALAGLITAMVYCWWQPAVLAVCAILSICLVSASVVSREQRRAALVLLVVMMAGFGDLVLTLGLPALYQHLDFAGPMGDAEMQKHPAALWTAFCMLFLMTPSVMTIAFSRMQNWLRRNSPPDMETSRQSLS
jgi:hypothetical protein